MSDEERYPPPGAPPPGGAQPGRPQGTGWTPAAPPPPGPYAGPPGTAAGPPGPLPTYRPSGPPSWLPGAVHKPGAVPLRPLRLGDVLDAAFRVIRFNPQATVGAAVLVAAVTMAVPTLLTLLLSLTVDLGLDLAAEDPAVGADAAQVAALLAAVGAFLLGLVGLQVGLVLVTGMVTHVTSEAAVGRRLSLGQAWAATRGVRWRLVGLSLLLALVGALALGLWVVTVVVVATLSEVAGILYGAATGLLVVVPLGTWLWVRAYYLATPALVVERQGVVAAVRRSWTLTRGQFWRTLGIAVLTALITGFAGNLLSFPLTIGGQLAAVAVPQYALVLLLGTNALATVVSTAFVAPFSGAVAALQYVDQRIRKEGYDVELMARAGILER